MTRKDCVCVCVCVCVRERFDDVTATVHNLESSIEKPEKGHVI